MFDKDRLLKNINILIKERGLKIGELETSVGVSTGYLSRLHRAETNVIPGIDFVSNIADALDVSIDALINSEFDRPNDNTMYMANFLKELISDTNQLVYDWELSISTEATDNAYGTGVTSELKGNKIPSDYNSESTYFNYRSRFNPGANLVFDGKHYFTEIDGMGVILLFAAEDPKNRIGGNVFELYSLDYYKNMLIPICSTLDNDGVVDASLKDLYASVLARDKDLKISNDAKELIEKYLKKKSHDQ
ncbi:helix-turn-helix domain-containing protein [Ohessyouella blattaphilus]|uniref:Helix-turn-helix domain-containing protein n=1 Tax=Ohessyouella blattaphilus TaxID=2949333 RepID=A0ABT1EJL1_9FIRM|nr:helix-turn-helix transcriptional regulator [Ohessyouella blattaphilus]MCP1110883.1 helix-turn-helix domain-containing protein [Ohessyouella blattaphilus]MCR8564277.1 helix-turn-helix domain-containing protein [Ohessyouella blattaphilus]